jgi:hypothetical protein
LQFRRNHSAALLGGKDAMKQRGTICVWHIDRILPQPPCGGSIGPPGRTGSQAVSHPRVPLRSTLGYCRCSLREHLSCCAAVHIRHVLSPPLTQFDLTQRTRPISFSYCCVHQIEFFRAMICLLFVSQARRYLCVFPQLPFLHWAWPR